ncbi:RsmE family RNA methyltransferase [Dethiobacter alkaliphilus]|uniref:RsmE family RNA methyltransferase n=1 Tax=Dethiobacter alkaliphilus TaxID=427926 RepID=UPI0022267323|nr:RsmE family RNA methyltransferase [Dethiobacter alkaliphilus]MCW3489322.1 16S rRNA (uracil(1498)-N(3))-methyltransferase [Dethiobacter alkaliphilus]
MSRFFYGPAQVHGDEVILTDDDAHHLLRVLRASVGQEVELCDDKGSCRWAVIAGVDHGEVRCRLGHELPDSEAGIRFYLAFGVLKGEKTEFILQKATELGAAGFFPFTSERSVVRPDKKAEKIQKRWQKIIHGAAAQSRRAIIPQLNPPCKWPDVLDLCKTFDKVVFFWESEEDRPLAKSLEGCSRGDRVLLITGPEGGFSAKEAAALGKLGIEPVTLGPRILRAETAAVVATAVALYQVGELGGK